ncbi:MAG: hypothetical protein ABIK76_05445, partial [candidate division WOR-3 bacterium]
MRAKIFILLIFFLSLGFSQVERWVYRYNGPQNGDDFAKAIVQDNQGNLYIAGSDGDFIVISLTSDGEERWIYRYNGTANSDDGANSIIYGIDGNLYICGYTTNNQTNIDFTVISLEPLPAIEERKSISLPKLKINNFGREIELIFNLSQSMKIP